jgi:phosphate transport system permease protein
MARPPTRMLTLFDVLLALATRAFGIAVLLLLLALALEMLRHAAPAIAEHGLGFLLSSRWDAGHQKFGVLPQIVGTLHTSLLALLAAGCLGVVAASVLSQGFLPRSVELVMKNVVELLAAIWPGRPRSCWWCWGSRSALPRRSSHVERSDRDIPPPRVL